MISDDDEYTGEHSYGVIALALQIADEMGLDEDERRLVEFGALLHDVGKIGVPKEIINKAGPLDDEEWAIMKQHTVYGQQMLDKVGGSMTDVGVVVRASHERWDGKGYPDGTAGEDVPLRGPDRRRWPTRSARSRRRAPTAAPSRPRRRSRSCGAARARSSTRRSSTPRSAVLAPAGAGHAGGVPRAGVLRRVGRRARERRPRARCRPIRSSSRSERRVEHALWTSRAPSRRWTSCRRRPS